MRQLSAFGITIPVPTGWDARMFRHDGGGEPTLHLASFTLPHADGEFGTAATGRMPPDAIFLSVTEYGVDGAAGRGLFASPPPRALLHDAFGEHTLLLPRPGQRGVQRFFSTAGRDFCLYAVLSAGSRTRALLAAANESLAALAVAPRADASRS
jgi:hypothetical protein